QGIFLLQ
ncbi:NLPA lipofamily protein, partial [Chlamydia psittaci 06-1683]